MASSPKFRACEGEDFEVEVYSRNANAVPTTALKIDGSAPSVAICPGASMLLGFFGATAVAQPSSAGEATGFTAGGGTTATSTSTWTGNVGTKAYTTSDIVKHLKNLGLIAAS